MSYSVFRLSSESDKSTLLKFWNENHEKELNEKYQWMYEGNPSGKAVVSMITDTEKQECIGCSAVFPRQISLKGTKLRTGVCGDLLVHKEHRVLAPALRLVRNLISFAQEQEFDLVYLVPNKQAEPVMKRGGFKCLGSNVRLAKLMTTSEQLQKMVSNKYLVRLLSRLLDFVLKMISFETFYRFKGRNNCEEVIGFGARFDRLWQKSKSRFLVAGERTSEFLTWKFLQKPGVEYKTYVITDNQSGELEGYIIYCMDENSISIKDCILPEGGKAIRVFMTHFLRHARKLAPTSVTMQFLENKEMTGLFKRFGFVERKSDWHTYYSCNEQLLKRYPALKDSGNWLLSNFDMDS